MRIELVIFDMAGTTVYDDDAVNRCLRGALETTGLSFSLEEVNRVMGIPKPTAIRMLLQEKTSRAPSDEEVTRLHDGFLERMLTFYRTDPAVRPVEGAEEVFARLRKAGMKVALDTGFSRDIVDVILKRLRWSDSRIVDTTVASDEVKQGRPHPDLVFECMRRTGVTSAQHVAKVGDTPADLQEGDKAGCGLVIGVTNGTHTREQLMSHPHTHLIHHLHELPALLNL